MSDPQSSYPKAKTEPTIVAGLLWMAYDTYEELRDFIYSREDEILEGMENLGSLFSVLQWVNRIENELRSSPTTARKTE